MIPDAVYQAFLDVLILASTSAVPITAGDDYDAAAAVQKVTVILNGIIKRHLSDMTVITHSDDKRRATIAVFEMALKIARKEVVIDV